METVTPHYLHVRPYTSRKTSAAAYPSRPVGDRHSKRHFSLFVTRRRTNRTWCYSTMDMGVAFIADPDRSTANLYLMVQSD
jgi:hypothetical protein